MERLRTGMAHERDKQRVELEDFSIEVRKNPPDVLVFLECFAVPLKLGKNSADLPEYVQHATEKIDEGARRLQESSVVSINCKQTLLSWFSLP